MKLQYISSCPFGMYIERSEIVWWRKKFLNFLFFGSTLLVSFRSLYQFNEIGNPKSSIKIWPVRLRSCFKCSNENFTCAQRKNYIVSNLSRKSFVSKRLFVLTLLRYNLSKSLFDLSVRRSKYISVAPGKSDLCWQHGKDLSLSMEEFFFLLFNQEYFSVRLCTNFYDFEDRSPWILLDYIVRVKSQPF